MCALKTEFKYIYIDDLTEEVKLRKKQNWHFTQMLAVKSDKGVDLVYSFLKKDKLENLEICNVTEKDEVPSITDEFIAAFVFENEAHDLFGVNITGIAIDFEGKFYNIAEDKPMTVLSPEAIARKEKQAKVAAAMAAKKAKAAAKKKAEASSDKKTANETKKEGK